MFHYRRTADVRSVGYSELFSLSREDVLNAMKDYPEARVSKHFLLSVRKMPWIWKTEQLSRCIKPSTSVKIADFAFSKRLFNSTKMSHYSSAHLEKLFNCLCMISTFLTDWVLVMLGDSPVTWPSTAAWRETTESSVKTELFQTRELYGTENQHPANLKSDRAWW